MTGKLNKGRILAEAGDLFVTHGASGVTMRGLAQRIGVTPMALYRHFPSRDQLLQAIYDEGHSTFLGYLHRALAASTPADRLVESGRQYLIFAVEHPREYAVMFMEHVPRTSGEFASEHWLDAATFRFLVDRIRDCQATGDLCDGDPEDVALSIWAHVHGLASLYLAGKIRLERHEFEKIYLRSIFHMLGAFGLQRDAASGSEVSEHTGAIPHQSKPPRRPTRES